MRNIIRFPFYIFALVINAISSFSAKIPSWLRSIFINIPMLTILFIGILNCTNPRLKSLIHYTWDGPFNVMNIGVVMLFLLVLGSIDRKISIKDLKFNPVFWIGWFICFGMMFVTSFMHYVQYPYFTWSIVSIFVFPLLFITWADRFSEFAQIVGRNVVIITYVFILMNLVMTPFIARDTTADGYLGVATNPNSNGMIINGFFAGCLYMLLTSKRRKIIYVIPTAFAAVLPIVAGCRTAEIAVILETLVGIIYYRKCIKAGEIKTSAAKVIITIVSITLIAGIFGFILNSLDTVDLNSYAITGDEVYENLPNDFVRKIDDVSSGRIKIWVTYVDRATLLGNGSPKKPVIEGYRASLWAHNNSLDILYASGYIAFAGYWIFLISGLAFIFKSLFSKRNIRAEYLLVLMTFIGYFTEAMLELTMNPLTASLAFLVYLTLIPIAIRRAE